MLHFIQVHRTLSVKGVQIYSVETKAWRVSACIFHYTLPNRLIVLPRSLCYLPSPRKHRKPENASGIPTESINAFHSTYFFFFSFHVSMFFFFLLKGLFTIKYFWPKTAKRSFSFSQKPVFQSGSGRLACEQALLFGRPKRAAKPRGAGSPVPRFRVFSRVPLARLLFTVGGGWGLWARNIAHRTCRKLCVLPMLKQNSVRA